MLEQRGSEIRGLIEQLRWEIPYNDRAQEILADIEDKFGRFEVTAIDYEERLHDVKIHEPAA
jgi:hypothetical protein